MSLGKELFDKLTHSLVESQFDFDAVEQGDFRAEWTDDGTEVAVRNQRTAETVIYTADDHVLATSDREVRNARQPTGEEGR